MIEPEPPSKTSISPIFTKKWRHPRLIFATSATLAAPATAPAAPATSRWFVAFAISASGSVGRLVHQVIGIVTAGISRRGRGGARLPRAAAIVVVVDAARA